MSHEKSDPSTAGQYRVTCIEWLGAVALQCLRQSYLSAARMEDLDTIILREVRNAVATLSNPITQAEANPGGTVAARVNWRKL